MMKVTMPSHASGEVVLFVTMTGCWNIFSTSSDLQAHAAVRTDKQLVGKQRPDVAIYDYQNGRKLLVDVPITHP